ncbi:MAG: sulfatase-like hydrolase/transferase [Acidobacteria bacterium]|nr:sulfatase-like hydrolase/transferase [Acidobacteriota bacterium]
MPLLLAPRRRPENIVLILADDLGSGDLSCYGSASIRTPRIDSLARDGVRFTQAYANAPECTPTRTALLTGRYQQRVGGLECAIGVGNQGRYDEAQWLQKRGELGLPGELSSLPRLLRRAGYETASIGKWHLGYDQKYWPREHGFDYSEGVLGGNADYYTRREEDGRPVYFEQDRLVERQGHTTDVIADAALRYLRARDGKRPFFLYLPFTAPHTPMQPGYRELVEQMDRRVGDILDELERRRLAENTAVMFLSDNGADPNGSNGALRGRKSSVFEGGIRVPWLMRWPGVTRPGTLFNEPAMTMDVLPTFVAGAQPADGLDLRPALSGKGRLPERTMYWRYKRQKNVRKAVRMGQWKLVQDDAQRYLFQLSDDPGERVNLYGERAKVRKEMEDRLARWEEDVRAPRLREHQTQASQ